MSLPTNFYIGRLGRSKSSDFIWALPNTANGDFSLYQLNSDTLAVENKITPSVSYNSYFGAGQRPFCCDDEGNIYVALGINGVGSTDRIVSFAPNGSFRWENRLGTTASWSTAQAMVRYKKSEDKIYVYAKVSNSSPGTTSFVWRIDPDGTNEVQIQPGGATGFTAGDTVRCFEVAEDSNVMAMGGSNTSSSNTIYFVTYSGTTGAPLSGYSVQGGALGMSYSPISGRFYYSSQYNNDIIYGAKINNKTNPTSISNTQIVGPGAYMYGGSVTADTHPLFSSTGGCAFFSFYDGNQSYMIQDTNDYQWDMDNVYSNANVGITINSGTRSACYNPNNGRFYQSAHVGQNYSAQSADIVSFTHNGTISQVSNHLGFGGQIKTASGWQSTATPRQMYIQHSSSTATQNGL